MPSIEDAMPLLQVMWPVCLGTLFVVVLGAVQQHPKTHGKVWRMVESSWRSEFIGTIVMIACTFSPGKWWGAADDGSTWMRDWAFHSVGVVLADYSCGGPHVNPGVTATMWALGKCGTLQAAVHVGAQLAGGLVAFPLLQHLADLTGQTRLGGPEYHHSDDEGLKSAVFNEFMATFLLLLVIFAVNWEPSAKMQKHPAFYWIKQTLTAFAIRALIVYFPVSGPAINGMLGTTWSIYSTGGWPAEQEHYAVYWVAHVAGGLAAGALYTLYKPSASFFGYRLTGGKVKSS